MPSVADVIVVFWVFIPILIWQKKSFDELIPLVPGYATYGWIIPMSFGLGIICTLCIFQDKLHEKVYGKVRFYHSLTYSFKYICVNNSVKSLAF